jgi:hypothetical protein
MKKEDMVTSEYNAIEKEFGPLFMGRKKWSINSGPK